MKPCIFFRYFPSRNASHWSHDASKRHLQIVMSLVTSAFFAGGVHAESNFEEDFESYDKSWKEIALQLPSVPVPENLLPFYVSPTATQAFAIDAKSLSVGTDGVVRFTLITTSAAGARNISYEGIRCHSWEHKLYAVGHPDGSWSRSRRDQWESIRNNTANRQHAALAGDYFCQGRTVAGKAEDIVGRLRRQQPFAQ